MPLKLNYQLMNSDEVRRTLDRMADEVLKGNDGRPVVLLGIQRRGVPMARRMAIRMALKTQKESQIGTLDINLYRDDLTRVAFQPVVGSGYPGVRASGEEGDRQPATGDADTRRGRARGFCPKTAWSSGSDRTGLE